MLALFSNLLILLCVNCHLAYSLSLQCGISLYPSPKLASKEDEKSPFLVDAFLSIDRLAAVSLVASEDLCRNKTKILSLTSTITHYACDFYDLTSGHFVDRIISQSVISHKYFTLTREQTVRCDIPDYFRQNKQADPKFAGRDMIMHSNASTTEIGLSISACTSKSTMPVIQFTGSGKRTVHVSRLNSSNEIKGLICFNSSSVIVGLCPQEAIRGTKGILSDLMTAFKDPKERHVIVNSNFYLNSSHLLHSIQDRRLSEKPVPKPKKHNDKPLRSKEDAPLPTPSEDLTKFIATSLMTSHDTQVFRKKQFTLSACVFVGFYDFFRIPEFVNFHRNIGFEHFIFYHHQYDPYERETDPERVATGFDRNASELHDVNRFHRLEKIKSHLILMWKYLHLLDSQSPSIYSYVPWTYENCPALARATPGIRAFSAQWSADISCLRRLEGISEWVAIFDIDEYFYPSIDIKTGNLMVLRDLIDRVNQPYRLSDLSMRIPDSTRIDIEKNANIHRLDLPEYVSRMQKIDPVVEIGEIQFPHFYFYCPAIDDEHDWCRQEQVNYISKSIESICNGKSKSSSSFMTFSESFQVMIPDYLRMIIASKSVLRPEAVDHHMVHYNLLEADPIPYSMLNLDRDNTSNHHHHHRPHIRGTLILTSKEPGRQGDRTHYDDLKVFSVMAHIRRSNVIVFDKTQSKYFGTGIGNALLFEDAIRKSYHANSSNVSSGLNSIGDFGPVGIDEVYVKEFLPMVKRDMEESLLSVTKHDYCKVLKDMDEFT